VIGPRVGGMTIRAVLILGFGLTLGIWVFAGYDIARRMSHVEHQATAFASRYIEAQELLSTIRAEVLFSSILVRDAISERDPAATAANRARLLESSTAAIEALKTYTPLTRSEGQDAQIKAFGDQLGAFHVAARTALEAAPLNRSVPGAWLPNATVIPEVEQVIRLSEEIQTLNRLEYVHGQQQITADYGAAERISWWRLGFALTCSLAIALFATLYANRLETKLQRRWATEEQHASDLQRLSNRLVTVQEEERRSIARELHDEVGQLLGATKVELTLALRHIGSANGPHHALETAQQLVDGALHTVRDLSRLLHPSVLDDLGLIAALEPHVQAFQRRHGIRTELVHEDMESRLAPEIELAAYRIVQEALTNVARHSGASQCRVSLHRRTQRIAITVEDQGRGFEVQADASTRAVRGLGLISIRERATLMGGTVAIESAPGTGTRLSVELPARTRAEERFDPGADEDRSGEASPQSEASIDGAA